MTPDLQARIEALARECVKDAIICECQSCQIGAVRSVKNALTTLAEQIIAEKDAGAAGIIETIEGVWDAASDVNAHQAVAYLSDCLEKIKERRPTAGRDTLAELVQLRERVRELEGRIERYENSGRV